MQLLQILILKSDRQTTSWWKEAKFGGQLIDKETRRNNSQLVYKFLNFHTEIIWRIQALMIQIKI